ncbi:histidinol dehydrogenase [Paenibacillus sp. J31TS4]|uniref:histidinol dehydrogenase n=1 Tax=Paenibacillus sp. J31TS4 TaxID=2807195 RepID=UPI001B0D4BE9|nr:histidinol dehydrogenase [Paenibacillus sp. J31TS4]GIP36982.1 histidinol dehydrogenase [Paenibacillus sp. J31TS4]
MNLYRYPREKARLEERFRSHGELFSRDVLAGVGEIFEAVAREGDEAVKEATRRFDGIELASLQLTDEYLEACLAGLAPSLREAIERLIANVVEVNRCLLPVSWEKEIRLGTIIGERFSPLDTVGIWIPARKGPLLSTAIMLVAAAKTAGVPRIVVGVPPQAGGQADPGTVAAARLAGADAFVIGNGVAIIAAFTHGTASIPAAAGIFGPGPAGIAAAMSLAVTYGKKSALGIGPTESMIAADETADPRLLVRDLINEAEHGPDSSSLLLTTSQALADETARVLEEQIEEADEGRRDYLRHVFGPLGKGAIVVADSWGEAAELINWFAPEHLMVTGSSAMEQEVLGRLKHAGEVLLGSDTPFSAANYAIGITAVLPTNHYARAFSGVTSKDMMKASTIGRLTSEALEGLYPMIRELGAYERLPGHIQAAAARVAGRE